MPEETIRAFQDHGIVAPMLERGLDEAKRVFEQLAWAGVDSDDLTATLKRKASRGSRTRFEELLNTIEAKPRELVPA